MRIAAVDAPGRANSPTIVPFFRQDEAGSEPRCGSAGRHAVAGTGGAVGASSVRIGATGIGQLSTACWF